MAATTLDRNTLKRKITRQIVLPLAAATNIPIGVLVAVATPSVGAVNASDTATHVVMGVSCMAVSAAAGDTKVVVERGVFQFANDGTITAASVGQLATVLDNQTVSLAATTTNDIGAGFIEEVDADGVWISLEGGKVAAA